MTAFNATVAESVNVFGLGPSDKWAERNWAVFKWGYGTNEISGYLRVVVDGGATVAGAAPVGLATSVDEVAPLLGDAPVSPGVVVAEVQAPSGGLEHVYKQDQTGAYYEFPDRTTDGESLDVPTWAAGGRGAQTWTSGVVSSTSWS